jgi:acetyl esterase
VSAGRGYRDRVLPVSSYLAAADLWWKRVALRTALSLPEPVQRALAGGRVRADGQTLATDSQLMLRLQRVAHEPTVESLPIDRGRRALVRQAAIAGGRQPIGSVRDLTVGERPGRLYTPTGTADPGALLVFFHGGGFVYGDLDSHDAACRHLAEHSGVRVLAVDYRLAPEHPYPAAYDDAVAAYRWVTANTGSLGAEPHRLAVGGDSAGGTLAALTALAAAREGLPLAFQLLIYPGTDWGSRTWSKQRFSEGFYLSGAFMEVAERCYVPDPAQRSTPGVSPLRAEIPPGLAPAYVATAGFDPLRDEGESYARKLADAGVEVELRRFPDQIHGFFNVVGVGSTARTAAAEVAARLAAGLARGDRTSVRRSAARRPS